MERKIGRELVQQRQIIEPFQIFCLEKREDVAMKNPNLNSSEVTSLLGYLWRSLTPEKKEFYISMSIRPIRTVNETQSYKMNKLPKPKVKIPKAIENTKVSQKRPPMIYVVPRGSIGKEISEVSFSLLQHTLAHNKY